MINSEEFMSEVITDTAFANLADVVIDRNKVILPEHVERMKKFSCVVFCQTDTEQKLFDLMRDLGTDSKKYILVTHRSDYSVDAASHTERRRVVRETLYEEKRGNI
jgi:hypothetical protein